MVPASHQYYRTYMVSLSRDALLCNAKTILTIEAWLRLGTRFCRHILFQRLSARFRSLVFMKCNINIDVGKYMTKGSSDGQGIMQGTGISARASFFYELRSGGLKTPQDESRFLKIKIGLKAGKLNL